MTYEEMVASQNVVVSDAVPAPSKGVFGRIIEPVIDNLVTTGVDLAGNVVSGIGDFSGSQMFKDLGEGIASMVPDEMRQDVQATQQMDWFDDSPWYDLHPSNIPNQIEKSMALLGSSIPSVMSYLFARKVGAKVGAPNTMLNKFSSELAAPIAILGYAQAHPYFESQRAKGIDEDIIRKDAISYAAIQGLVETMKAMASVGAFKAGQSGSIVSPGLEKGTRFLTAKILKSAGRFIPEELDEGLSNVGSLWTDNHYTQGNIAEMKRRYGEQWKPNEEVVVPTGADYTKAFMEGALAGGMFRALGFTKRIVSGDSKPGVHEKLEEALNQINPHSKHKILARENTEDSINALETAFDSRGFQRQLTKMDKSPNELDNSTSVIIKKIVAAKKSGNMQEAVNLFDRHAGTVTVPNDSTADDIVKIAKKIEADNAAKPMQERRNIRKGVDASGKSYIIADKSILPTPEDARRLHKTVRLEVDYEDKNKWLDPFTKDNVKDDKYLAEAMDIPYKVDPSGRVMMDENDAKSLQKQRSIIEAYLATPEGKLHAGAPLGVNHVSTLKMTREQLRAVGRESMITPTTRWYSQDGKPLAQEEDGARIRVSPKAANYFDESGKIRVDLNYGNFAQADFVEELLESGMKRGGTPSVEVSKAQDRLRDLVEKWTRSSALNMGKEIMVQESKRISIDKIGTAEGRKSTLINQLRELETHIQSAKLPDNQVMENVMKEFEAERLKLEKTDLNDNRVAQSKENYIRSKQREYGILSDADIAADLYKRLNDATDANANQIELFSNTWNLTQFGHGEKMSVGEKNLLKYLNFDPSTASEIESLMRTIHGDKLYEAMRADGKPMAVQEFYRSPEEIAAQKEKVMVDKITGLETLVKDLAGKVQRGEAIKPEDVAPKPAAEEAAASDQRPTGEVPPLPEAVPAQAEGTSESEAKSITQKIDEIPNDGTVDSISKKMALVLQARKDEAARVAEAERKASEGGEEKSFAMSEVLDGTQMMTAAEDVHKADETQTKTGESISERMINMNKKYNSVTDLMADPNIGAFSSRSQAETMLGVALFDNKEIETIFSIKTSDADFNAWLKSTVPASDPNAYVINNFKSAILVLMDDKTVTREFVRSMREQYSVFAMHEHTYVDVDDSVSSYLNGKNIRVINKMDRLNDWKKTVNERIAAIEGNPELQKELRSEFAKLELTRRVGTEFVPAPRAPIASFLEKLTGISETLWISATEGFWDGIGKGLSVERKVSSDGTYRILVNDTEGVGGWQRMAKDLLTEVSDVAKSHGVTQSNLEHLVTQSSDRHAYSMHGRDMAQKLRITAAVNSPYVMAMKKLATERGTTLDKLMSKFTGIKRNGTPIEWQDMTDTQRTLIMTQYADRGYVLAPPFGDKTDANFIKYPILSRADASKQYALKYEAMSATMKKLFISPTALDKLMKGAETHERFSEVHPGTENKIGMHVSRMWANKALHDLDMYRRFYGNFEDYAKGKSIGEKELKNLAYDIIKRGSQFTSGGPAYRGALRVMIVDKFSQGDNDALADGAMYHSDEMARKYKDQMGSEYNSDVLKPYFQIDEAKGRWGLKCASYRIGMFSQMKMSDGKVEPMHDAIAKTISKYKLDFLADKNSAKYFPPGTVFVNPLSKEGKFDSEMDLSSHIIEVSESKPSMFVVQNIDKDADAAVGILSRQLHAFSMAELPSGKQRADINKQMLSIVVNEFDKSFKGGKALPELLGKLLKSDRHVALRAALIRNGENQKSILHSSELFGSLMNYVAHMMEPKTLSHNTVQVPMGMLNLPEFAKNKNGRNDMPWFSGNVKMKDGNFRDAKAFDSEVEAQTYLDANASMHLDLATFDDNGIPVFDEGTGIPKWSGSHIREYNGKFWVPGDADFQTRVPSDSPYSGAPYRRFTSIDSSSETGITAITEKGKKDNGGDHDGDSLFGSMFFKDKNNMIIFGFKDSDNADIKLKALMNRRLALTLRDYETVDLKYLTTDKAFSDGSSDLESLKNMAIRIAKNVGRHTIEKLKTTYGADWGMSHPPMNTPDFNNFMLKVYDGASMLGIAAKGKSAMTMERLHGATMQPITLKGFKVGDETYPDMVIDVSPERAAELQNDFAKRTDQGTVPGRTMINFLVDDAKNPAAYLLMNYDTAGMAMTAMQGMDLSPANREANLTKLFMWLNHSPEMKEFNSLMAEVKLGKRKLVVDIEKGETTYASVYKKLAKTEAGQNVIKLYGVAKARQQIGRLTDMMTAANPPQDVGSALMRSADFESVLSREPTYLIHSQYQGKDKWYVSKKIPKESKTNVLVSADEIYNPGDYSNSPWMDAAFTYNDTMLKIVNDSPYKTLQALLKDPKAFPFLEQNQREAVLKAFERTIAVRAVHQAGIDPSKAPNALQQMKQDYPEGSKQWDLLKHLTVESDKTMQGMTEGIKITAEYRRTEMNPHDSDKARAAWDSLKPTEQAVLAEYLFQRYGINTSTYGGSYATLMGSKYRRSIDAKMTDSAIGPAEQQYLKSFVEKTDEDTDIAPEDLGMVGRPKTPFFKPSEKPIVPDIEKDKVVQPQQGVESRSPETAGETIVGPIIYNEDTGELYRGEIGEQHQDIIDRVNAIRKIIPDDNEQYRMFETSTGGIASREESAEISGIPTLKEPGKLHSSDLIAFRKKQREVGQGEMTFSMLKRDDQILGLIDPETMSGDSTITSIADTDMNHFKAFGTKASMQTHWRYTKFNNALTFYEPVSKDIRDSVEHYIGNTYGIKKPNVTFSATEAGDTMVMGNREIVEVIDKDLAGKPEVVSQAKIALKSLDPDRRKDGVDYIRTEGSIETAKKIHDILDKHDRDGIDLVRFDIGDIEHITYAMRLADEFSDGVKSLDNGKYGTHRAYYEAMDLLKAKINTASGKAAKWHKVLPVKQFEAWEIITREIDKPGHLDSVLKANKDMQKVFTPEVKKMIEEVRSAYDTSRNELNDYMSNLTHKEWIRQIEDYINRVYAKKNPEAQKNLNEWTKNLETKHGKQRKIPTIEQAEKMGFRLKETDASKLFQIYTGDTWSVATHSMAIHKAMMIRNESGDMQVIPVFKGEGMFKPKAHEVASLNEVADGLAMALNDTHSMNATWGGIRESFGRLAGKDFQKQDYKYYDSPYDEYSGFWVHKDSNNVGQMLFDHGWQNKTMSTISRINNWSKFLTLGLSAFHPFALWEATVAALHKDAFKLQGIRPRFVWNVDNTFKTKMEDPYFQEMWIKNGLSVSPNPNVDSGMIARDLNTAKAWAEDHGNKAATWMVKSMQIYKEFMDKHLWENFHSHAKLYTAEHLYMKMKSAADKSGSAWDDTKMREEISKTVNQGYGGLNFDRMMYATPKVRQMLQTFMFAPDWTLTNFTSARAGIVGAIESVGGGAIPGMEFLGTGLTQTQKKWALTVHWPAMLTFMVAWPNVLQAAIYAAFGDDEKGDRPFAVENEFDKQFHVDVTPMFRELGWYENPDNPKERVYMKFAKQAWEVKDMIENPIKSLKGKSSAAFRMAYEQVTNANTLGAKFAFADETLWGGLFGSDKGWVESRTGVIAAKFVPMSILTMFGEQPPSFLAPTSKGMTRAKTEIELARVLTAYADPGVWDRIQGNTKYEEKLANLAPEILEAAKRNGVNVEEALKTAVSHVRSKYYDRFWRAFNRGDQKALEESSRGIVRMHGTLGTLLESMAAKERRVGSKITSGEAMAVTPYMREAMAELRPSSVTQNVSQRKSIEDLMMDR